MNYLFIKFINNIKPLGLIMLMFLSFSSFSQSSESKMHYIFVIDNTGSLLGLGGGGAKNIWEPVKTKITETILSLDEKEESVISVYTFASDLKIRNIGGLMGGMAIKEMPVNSSTKIDISKTIKSLKATGKETCIYKSFKTLIDDLSANDNKKLEKYNTRIFLFTDSEEDCVSGPIINCENAFDKWCEIKSDQDFASIIKLEESNAASSLLSCISDNSCIEVIKEPITQITKVIENDPSIEFNSSQLKKILNFNKSLNIDAAIQTSSSIKFQLDNNCLIFRDNFNNILTEVNVLNQTIVLSGINDCSLQQGEIIEGHIIYDKIIFENKEIKLILKYPKVKFAYINDAIPGIKHDYRK
jgi:hypothetical protein|tara:strand:+ start:7203 stop:8273 length:1071 start_codon:yes stop_codon:yes gene_type:complete